jgi:hypothetical protein
MHKKNKKKRGKWLAVYQKTCQNDKKTRKNMAVLKPPFDCGLNFRTTAP